MATSYNNTRYATRIGYPVILWMVAVAILFGCCGVTYAFLKHEQVLVRTEIRELQREIAICNLNANQYRAKANALTNRWAMRARLNQDHSALQDIRHGQIEVARYLPNSALASFRDMNYEVAATLHHTEQNTVPRHCSLSRQKLFERQNPPAQ